MKIQIDTEAPTGNKEFKCGHIYRHISGQVYLCSHHHDGADRGRYLIHLKDGILYSQNVLPEFYNDITDQVSLQEVKK